MSIKSLPAPARAIRFECPRILRVFPAKDVAVASRNAYAEKRRSRQIPAILHLLDIGRHYTKISICLSRPFALAVLLRCAAN